MANEFKITDVVDQKAINDLEKLKNQYRETMQAYVDFTKQLADVSKINPKNYQELSQKSANYNNSLKELISTQNKLTDIQNKQLSVLKQVSTQLGALASLEKLNSMFDRFAESVKKANDILSSISSTSAQAASGTQKIAVEMNNASSQLGIAESQYADIIDTIQAYDSQVTKITGDTILNNRQISELTKELKLLESEYNKGSISLDNYIKQSSLLKQRQTELSEENKRYSALIRNHSAAIMSTSGSYNEMNAAMLELQKRYKALSYSERNSPIGDNIVKQANTLNSKLKEIDAQFGNYQRNVGNYKSAFNGLGMQVQQISRELPNLALGLGTFLIAISNNLPMLADELKKSNDEFKALSASGQKATPVWKQLIGSIFSWQTALVVGLTVVVAYRKEISQFFSELFKGKEKIDSATLALQSMNAAISSGRNESIKELNNFKLLYRASTDISRSAKERKAATDELQRLYPDYLKNLSDDYIMSGKANEVYKQLTSHIIELSVAKAKMAQIDKLSAQSIDVSMKAAGKLMQIRETEVRLQAEEKKGRRVINGQEVSNIDALSASLKRQKKEYSDLTEELRNIYKAQKEIEKTIKVEDIIPKSTQNKSKSENEKEYGDLEEILRRTRELRLENMKMVIDDESVNYEERLRKLDQFLSESQSNININTQNEINEEQKKYQEAIKQKGLSDKKKEEREREYNLSIANIRRNAELEITNLTYDGAATRSKITEEEFRRRNELALLGNKQLEEVYANTAVSRDEMMRKELEDLEKQHIRKDITDINYEKRRSEIVNQYAIERAQSVIDLLERESQQENLTEEQKLDISKKISKAKIDLAKATSQAEIDAVKSVQAAYEKQLNDIADAIEFVGKILQGFAEIMSNQTEAEIQEIERLQEANEEAGEREKERIADLEKSGAISKEVAEARKRSAEKATADKNKELEKQKADIQTRQAKFEKDNAIIQAVIGIASGIIKTIASVGFPLAIPLIASIGALGAIQLATIISQPIPKYAKGSDNHPGGLAIVGDGGRQEVILTDDGAYITPSIPTLVDMPKHAQVIPNVLDYKKMALHSDVMIFDKMRRENGDPVIVNVNNDYSRLERRFEDVYGENRKMVRYMKKMARSAEYRYLDSRL